MADEKSEHKTNALTTPLGVLYFGVSGSLIASAVFAKVESLQSGVAVLAIMLGLLCGYFAYTCESSPRRLASIIGAVALVGGGACAVTAQIVSDNQGPPYEQSSPTSTSETSTTSRSTQSTQAQAGTGTTSTISPALETESSPATAVPSAPTTTSDPSIQVPWGDQTYMDFDRIGDGGSPKVSTDSGPEFEAYLQFAQLSIHRENSFDGARMTIIDDESRTAEACEGSTQELDTLLILNRLTQRQAICISTSEGRWAILKPGPSSKGGVTLDPIAFDILVL